MSDLFQPEVPISFINDVFAVMNQTPRHRYQILTKRSQRLRAVASEFSWTDNIWMGVSVETERYQYRVDHLREVPARIRFLSLEPLLGPMPNLDLSGIHWVIVGGESGPRARSLSPEWVRTIRDQCEIARIPFFFKQWGGRTPKAGGRTLDDSLHDRMPI